MREGSFSLVPNYREPGTGYGPSHIVVALTAFCFQYQCSCEMNCFGLCRAFEGIISFVSLLLAANLE